jgi:hypothetical protein
LVCCDVQGVLPNGKQGDARPTVGMMRKHNIPLSKYRREAFPWLDKSVSQCHQRDGFAVIPLGEDRREELIAMGGSLSSAFYDMKSSGITMQDGRGTRIATNQAFDLRQYPGDMADPGEWNEEQFPGRGRGQLFLDKAHKYYEACKVKEFKEKVVWQSIATKDYHALCALLEDVFFNTEPLAPPQADHEDNTVQENEEQDPIAVVLTPLSLQGRYLDMWIVRALHEDGHWYFVPLWKAIMDGAITRRFENMELVISDPATYIIKPGWEVEYKEIYINLTHSMILDGYATHAGHEGNQDALNLAYHCVAGKRQA